jgi:hypothetical protein
MTSAWGEALKIDRARETTDMATTSNAAARPVHASKEGSYFSPDPRADGIEIVRVLHSACDSTVDDFES